MLLLLIVFTRNFDIKVYTLDVFFLFSGNNNVFFNERLKLKPSDSSKLYFGILCENGKNVIISVITFSK